ncbi:MAG: hypothetical protein AAF715_12315 [Myxococcota bacterium]
MAPIEELPRWSLAALFAPIGLGLGWLAFALPWRGGSAFALATAAAALGHLGVAGAAAARLRALPVWWRIQSALTVAYILFIGWGLLSSAWYLQATYRGLGAGVAAGLAVFFGAIAALLLPGAVWGLRTTRPPRAGGTAGRVGGGAALLVLIAVGASHLNGLEAAATGEALAADADVAAMEKALRSIDPAAWPKSKRRPPTLGVATPARCPAPLAPARRTALVSFIARPDPERPEAAAFRCLQADDGEALAADVARTLDREAQYGPVRVDLVARRVRPETVGIAFVERLALRPGLDGACRNVTCLAPWQLVVLDAFNRHAPIPGVADARLGASLSRIAASLGGALTERIATRGWILGPETDGPVALDRNQRPDATVSSASLRDAVAAAEAYVYAAQGKNGRFRYIVDPFTGDVVDDSLSLPRHAGTTLVVCELGAVRKRTAIVVERALGTLAAHARPVTLSSSAQGRVLRRQRGAKGSARMGPTALGLAALLRCRPRAGERHDVLIGDLARTLLHQQRPDGSFAHHLDLERGAPMDRRGSIYVDGQIVLALSLLEAAGTFAAATWPPAHDVRTAVERAMTYFGRDYWPRFIRPLGYLEENWHCIAAAASLGHHRHEAYERFCIDYVTFKSRFIHAVGTVREDLVGGYGVGNIVPPHNTATAGFGEAMASALQLLRARGEPEGEAAATLRAALTYLLRNQWRAGHCFACSPRRRIAGAFSEHPASARVRIDYVQHAWAALGHGGRALGVLGDGKVSP